MTRLRLDGTTTTTAHRTLAAHAPSPTPDVAPARAATAGYPTDDRLIRDSAEPGARWVQGLTRRTVGARAMPSVRDGREAVERESGFSQLGLFLGPLVGTRIGGESPLSPRRIRVWPHEPE